MKQESELGRLEKFVNSLLARYNALKEDNARLTQDVQERDEIIEDLRDSLAQLESERNEISNRVGGIIQQIEEWERAERVRSDYRQQARTAKGASRAACSPLNREARNLPKTTEE